MEDIAAFMVALIGIILILAVPIGGGFWLSYASCQSQLKVSGLKGTWGPLIDCQVKMSDGNYIPYNRWRGFESIELKRGK